MKEELIEIGLSSQEAEVYLHLLKKQGITATVIAKDVKINRTVIYSILDKLINKGLVNFVIINGTKSFSPANPKVLQDFLNDKQRILKEIMPSLTSLKMIDDEKFSCEVYEGINGGLVVLKDILRHGEDYISFGDEGQLEKLSDTIHLQYMRQLDEKNIHERIITKEGVEINHWRKKSETRFLPKEYAFPTSTTIYGDKVAIAILEEPYHIILINSKSLAKTYRSIFEGLWKMARQDKKIEEMKKKM